MIKMSEVKKGDLVYANYEGVINIGEVTRLQPEQHLALIVHGDQEFWYNISDLSPIPLDDKKMHELKFTKEVLEDGSVKYLKGAFRVHLFKPDDFTKMEIWYRQEKSLVDEPIYVHNLQNHYHRMTKTHLTEEAF